ncbi:hypothetical protein GCM10010343_68890 [Streptomyces avidinii]|nr:hypothetical protein GCM10010343_68890 [Streptomyces avidinii]
MQPPGRRIRLTGRLAGAGTWMRSFAAVWSVCYGSMRGSWPSPWVIPAPAGSVSSVFPHDSRFAGISRQLSSQIDDASLVRAVQANSPVISDGSQVTRVD